MQRSPMIRDILFILAASIILGLTVNALSAKKIPLLRERVEKIAVADSALFGAPPERRDTAKPPADTLTPHGTKVIAPLHEQALARAKSAVASGEKPVPASEPSLRIITLDQFVHLQKTGRPLIIDGRDSTSYLKAHVKGARNAYGLAIEDYFDKLVMVPRDTLVVVYCNNPDCHLGRMVIQFMHDMGFTNLFLYDDGWDGWEKAKMPVDTVVVTW